MTNGRILAAMGLTSPAATSSALDARVPRRRVAAPGAVEVTGLSVSKPCTRNLPRKLGVGNMRIGAVIALSLTLAPLLAAEPTAPTPSKPKTPSQTEIDRRNLQACRKYPMEVWNRTPECVALKCPGRSEAEYERAGKGLVELGMNECLVVTAYGVPDNELTTITAAGAERRLHWGVKTLVVLKDDKVVGIQH